MNQSPLPRSRPGKWPTASLRSYLIAVILVATVPLAGLTSAMIFEQMAATQRELERGLQRTTSSFALVVEREVASSADALTILSYATVLRQGDVPGFFQALVELPRRRPSWGAAYLTNTRGQLLFSTAQPLGARFTDLDDDAAARRVGETRLPNVSDLRPNPRAGAPTVAVNVPVIVDGKLTFVLGAWINPASWQTLIESAQLPATGRAFLVDSTGRVIARTARGGEAGTAARDAANRAGGTNLAQAATGAASAGAGGSAAGPVRTANEQLPEAARALFAGAERGIERTSLLAGEESYTAWQRVGTTGWVVGMDVPAAPLEQAYFNSVSVAIGAGLISLIAGLGFALLLARRVTMPLRQLALGGPGAVNAPEVVVREISLLRDALASAEAQRQAALDAMNKDLAERAALMEREKQARQESETSNRVKDEFLAMLSHELRNPLGAISAAAELLNRVGSQDAPSVNARRIISRQTRHLARLMDDLLDVARVITGKILLSRTPMNLASSMQRLLSTLEFTGSTRDHRVSLQAEEVWIDADMTRIEQVVNNLLTNALKYTPAGGRIDLRVGPHGDWAVVEVKDNGVGIAPALLPRLFDLFVQGDRTLDRRQGGLGIGLTLVRQLVELHGGSVTAHSENVGSVFEVRLPRIEPPEPEPRAVAARTGGHRRVLVIEDNEDALEVLRALLELSGHEVNTATDGTTGLQLLLDTRPDVALIDIGLPGLNGLEVAERARAAGHAGRLVALTGYGQAKDVERTRAAGFDAHLVKPVDPVSLQDQLG